MKTKIGLSVWLICSMPIISGCDLFGSNDDGVSIRVENASEHDMRNINVSFPEGVVSYGDLISHAISDYQKVSKAYRYAYIETDIDSGKAVLQPIDFFGEEYIDPGRYTYSLSIYGSSGTSDGTEPVYYLSLELKRD